MSSVDLGAVAVIDGARLNALVSVADAVDALEAALRDGLDPSADPARSVVGLASGHVLVMPAEHGGFAGATSSPSHRPTVPTD